MLRSARNPLLRAAASVKRNIRSPAVFSAPKLFIRSTVVPSAIIGIRNYSRTTDGKLTPEEVETLSVNEFHRISEDYLETLTDHLVDLGADNPEIDAEYSHGVLNLELPPLGSYVINKQPPNKQIWLSSPVSGPDRFDPIGGKWISLRTQESLGDVLRREVSSAVGRDVALEGIDDE